MAATEVVVPVRVGVDTALAIIAKECILRGVVITEGVSRVIPSREFVDAHVYVVKVETTEETVRVYFNDDGVPDRAAYMAEFEGSLVDLLGGEHRSFVQI